MLLHILRFNLIERLIARSSIINKQILIVHITQYTPFYCRTIARSYKFLEIRDKDRRGSNVSVCLSVAERKKRCHRPTERIYQVSLARPVPRDFLDRYYRYSKRRSTFPKDQESRNEFCLLEITIGHGGVPAYTEHVRAPNRDRVIVKCRAIVIVSKRLLSINDNRFLPFSPTGETFGTFATSAIF